jgi:hypothetical protein
MESGRGIGISRVVCLLAAACAIHFGSLGQSAHRVQAQDIGNPLIPLDEAPYDDEAEWLTYTQSHAPKTLFQWSRAEGFDQGADDEQRGPLVTDRPDFTESSSTVGRGVIQLEMGYTYITDNSSGERFTAHSYPEALLRVGVLAEWLELRAAGNFANELTHAGGHRVIESGAEDLYVGIKLALTEQHEVWPEMALIPQMLVPVGSSPLGNRRVLPGVNWTYSWELSDFLSTGGQSQINWVLDGETHREYVEFSQSWTLNYSLTDRLGAYTEWYALIPRDADTDGPQQYADGGFTFLVNDNVQLDVRAGIGLNEAADDFFTGAGLSIRY